MKKVLIVSPHFPPDSSAATHRVRLLAPHLSRYGWEPTVLTCRPDAYEGRLDPALEAMVPPSFRVVRTPALSARWTRRAGIGDLGLRSLLGLWRAANRLLTAERFDALFITIFPAYTSLLGPLLTRRFHLPFVIDYQDPWVSAWGTTVGGGVDGRADLKSRRSRQLALWLEPQVVRAAAAITAVSPGTYQPILARNPGITPITEAIPIGAEPADFAERGARAVVEMPFDPADGRVHVCYTGTILPLGIETLTALLRAVGLIRQQRRDVYERLRLHFLGTSNQTVRTDHLRVVPLAREIGVENVVAEVPTRLPYSAIVEIQKRASVLLAMGSSEPHYTASKIYPLLLARRPLLAIYHEQSTVTDLVRGLRSRCVSLVTYSETAPAGDCVAAIADRLVALVEHPTPAGAAIDSGGLSEFLAENLAGRLAGVFDRVVQTSPALARSAGTAAPPVAKIPA
jgi:hypothetical protein